MFGRKEKEHIDQLPEGTYTLLEVPEGQIYKIVEIKGGPGLHRRLLSLGFHRGDLITVDGQAIMRGPVLVRNMTTETRVALGRGIAQKILVQPAGKNE